MNVADEPAHYPVEHTAVHLTGRVISARTDAVRMPDGDVADRDWVEHPGSVGIIALDDEERVLLLRQYRHPPRRLLWEPPAGLLDEPGEAAAHAAARELAEEAGVRARDWAVLADIFTSPGMSDEALRIYLARGLDSLTADELHVGVHEEADMPVEFVPLDEAVDKVFAGELHNPTAVVGVLAAYAARARRWQGLRPVDAPWEARPDGAGSKA